MKAILQFVLLVFTTSIATAHEGHSHAPSPDAKKTIVRLNTEPPRHHLVAIQNAANAKRPDLANVFEPFKLTVGTRFDKDYLYVESTGMPAHPMMIGITAWQQQVPLPQAYTGENAWRIPLNPKPARTPMSTKEHFFRGAIALAANGVPIFNPIKNDGKTDTLEAGELDDWGGHCGRADDYHYHIAPVHLEKIVGVGNPIAIALDGYPIYGYNDPDGKPPTDLDGLNGHKGPDGKYHYHATKTFPYLNGGFFGAVVERDGQVDPQPRAKPIRPSLRGLKGAKITGFENPKPDSYALHYDVNGEKRSVAYTIAADGTATFDFLSQGLKTTETYQAAERRGGRDANRRNGTHSPNEKRSQGNRPSQSVRGGGQRDGLGGDRRGTDQGQGNGGNAIFRSLDRDRDGTLDQTEIQQAAASLLTLDTNRDGQLTGGEFRGPDRQRTQLDRPKADRDGNNRSNQKIDTRGRKPSNGPRQPWILVHEKEIDLDKDGNISRDEIVGEAEKSFGGYDTDRNGELSHFELHVKGIVRSAMGGFIRGHEAELDRDKDGVLTRKEVIDNATRMFARMDSDADGIITQTELEASRRTSGSTTVPQRIRGGRSGQKSDAIGHQQRSAPQSATGVHSIERDMKARTLPNFIFILIDDMGWKDTGFAGNDFIETPNTDRIAREGVIFSQAYASAPNCAPSRACILSGQYPPRHGIYTVVDQRHAPGSVHHKILAAHSKDTMDTNVVTIAECLKDAGYATAAFGMWNLGRGRSGPSTATGQGFDIYKKPQDCGFDRHDYFNRDGNFITDTLTKEGIEFIEDNKDRPFFLYLPYHAVHAPFQPKAELVAKYERKAKETKNRDGNPVYAAMIDVVDQNVGRIMKTLHRLQLDDNTMVVFTSDNGGTPQFVAPLNGSKGALYEGGIRVPACVWWSGIENAGRTCETPILGMDFYPTMLDAAGIDFASLPLDGVSFLPVLEDSGNGERDAVFWHFPSYIGRGKPSSAIRMGDWKLIEQFEDRRIELYHLTKDMGESRNLAASHPAKAAELYARLAAWQQETAAAIPSGPNPKYSPSAVSERRKGKRRGGQQREQRD